MKVILGERIKQESKGTHNHIMSKALSCRERLVFHMFWWRCGVGVVHGRCLLRTGSFFLRKGWLHVVVGLVGIGGCDCCALSTYAVPFYWSVAVGVSCPCGFLGGCIRDGTWFFDTFLTSTWLVF
ncbi:hypothetical protein ACSQ67_021277 [Phaseolus vulgaris]